jgi:hypothetical protein
MSEALVCCRNTVHSPLRMPLSATARATSVVISVMPRPRVRNSSVFCSIIWAVNIVNIVNVVEAVNAGKAVTRGRTGFATIVTVVKTVSGLFRA